MNLPIPSIAVLMTVYNRVDVTLQATASLREVQHTPYLFKLSLFLVDDASEDDTGRIVASRFPGFVNVTRTTGNFFWARGMALAQNQAAALSPDYLLWLNDDVKLNADSIQVLLQAAAERPGAIVVGATADNGIITYTGARRLSRRPGNLEPVLPDGTLQDVDAFNGNVVLVPKEVYTVLGTIDPTYAHAYGDNDYGLRARAAAIDVVLAPRPIGECPRNAAAGSWRDSKASRPVRTRRLFSRKGFPFKSHMRYNIRHGGPLGVVYGLSTYCKHLFSIWARKAEG